jgi:hypothetical protein
MEKIMEEIDLKLHKNYTSKFKSNRESDSLVITFSPTKKEFLSNINFSENVLYLIDKKNLYYIYNPASQVQKLNDFIVNNGFKKVYLIGSSKGGTGALLWASLLSNQNKNYEISCFSFSPIVQLTKENKHINYPSFFDLLKKAENDESIEKCLLKYGNINNYVIKSKCKVIVIYSSKYDTDRTEANSLDKEKIILLGVPLSIHGSINPFIQEKEPENIRKLADVLYKKSLEDKDLAFSLQKGENKLFEELMNISVPHIKEFIHIFD